MRKMALGIALLTLAGCNGSGGSGPRAAIDLSGVPLAEITYTGDDLKHLAYLLDEEQQGRYASLAEPAREEMMRIFWAEADPTPTTVENERRDEHYRRLAYVREHFAIDEDPGWDRRGELLLRYGVPDRRDEVPADIVEGRGLVPPKETWIYYGLGQAYQLEDPRFQGHFLDSYELAGVGRSSPRDIQASRDNINSFSDIPTGAQRSSFDDSQDPEAALQAQRLASMLEQGQEAYREKPQSYRHDYGGKELQFVFDVVNYEAESGKTRIDINTALWANDLQYTKDDAGYYAVLTTQAAVMTPDYRDVGRGERSTRDRKDSIDALEGRLVLDQTSIELEPGQYRLALSVTDSLSGNVGIFKTDLWARAFPKSELRMSDIQRALDVRSGRPGDNFLKGPYQV
ncbi:MAG: GWxTD domain-containing protein, partial [Gemmatimonadetes bacterium]|nr:GWxTD domain-containing protein [Gemmatimonadota bacterium]